MFPACSRRRRPRAVPSHRSGAALAEVTAPATAGAGFPVACSLGKYSPVGNLMGSLVGGNLWLEGGFARMMYLSLHKLHKLHKLALHGFWKVALDTLARMITRRTEPHVKLH